MRISKLLWALLPIPLFAACAHNNRGGSEGYYDNEALQPPPTSERAEPRVYPAPAKGEAPSGVSDRDTIVAEEVSRLLKSDPELAGASNRVLAVVENGVVKLRGTVPAEHYRTEMAERMRRLPGVVRVDDDLGISGER